MVRKRDLDYLIIAAMLLTGLYMASTGLVMDWFGLHQLAYHNYVGYAWAALAVLHVTLNWGRIMAYLRRRFRPKPERELQGTREEAKTPNLGRRQLLAGFLGLVAGFVLIRIFDIAKPPPVKQLEKLPDGLGVMADDWAAGVYACGALHLLLWLTPLGGVTA